MPRWTRRCARLKCLLRALGLDDLTGSLHGSKGGISAALDTPVCASRGHLILGRGAMLVASTVGGAARDACCQWQLARQRKRRGRCAEHVGARTWSWKLKGGRCLKRSLLTLPMKHAAPYQETHPHCSKQPEGAQVAGLAGLMCLLMCPQVLPKGSTSPLYVDSAAPEQPGDA